MNFPPFVYSKSFWQAVSLIVAVLVVYFFPESALTAAMIEGVALLSAAICFLLSVKQ